jgi:hypothetical protein
MRSQHQIKMNGGIEEVTRFHLESWVFGGRQSYTNAPNRKMICVNVVNGPILRIGM